MKLAIHQPCYIPYLGLFYKMYEADKFVFLDDAQYSSGYVFNWNVIKTPQGTCRLKIPIKQNFGDKLNKIVTRFSLGWVERHLKTIYMNYHKAKYFNDFYYKLKAFYLCFGENDTLADISESLFIYICDKFGICKPIVYSSNLKIVTAKEQRVIDICQVLGANEYISGNGAAKYQSVQHFNSAGIKLIYTQYKPIKYPQLWGNFEYNMSVIDYIFNNGFDWDGVVRRVEGRNLNG